MSLLGINKITYDFEHSVGLLDEFTSNPEGVLDRYKLTADERASILSRDAPSLLAVGVNAIVLRNLLVILGIPHKQMYTHSS